MEGRECECRACWGRELGRRTSKGALLPASLSSGCLQLLRSFWYFLRSGTPSHTQVVWRLAGNTNSGPGGRSPSSIVLSRCNSCLLGCSLALLVVAPRHLCLCVCGKQACMVCFVLCIACLSSLPSLSRLVCVLACRPLTTALRLLLHPSPQGRRMVVQDRHQAHQVPRTAAQGVSMHCVRANDSAQGEARRFWRRCLSTNHLCCESETPLLPEGGCRSTAQATTLPHAHRHPSTPHTLTLHLSAHSTRSSQAARLCPSLCAP